jgi:hypothetical protein
MAQDKLPNIDLSALTIDDVWELPESVDRYDENYPESELYKTKPNEIEAQSLQSRLNVSREMAELFTQIAIYNNGDDGNIKDRARTYEALIDQAKRLLAVKPVLEGNKNRFLKVLINYYVLDTNDYKIPPRKFLRSKLRNATIFFSVMGILGWLAEGIVETPETPSRAGCLTLVTIFTLLGILNYRNIPKQYRARQIFEAFLAERGLK